MIAVDKRPTRSTSRSAAPIKWHGGKHYLAARIIQCIPDHTHYVETHFGGGAVLFRKPQPLVEKHSEVVNDIDGRLTNFWRVLQNPKTFKDFKRRVQCIPFSKSEWTDAVACESSDPVDQAVAFFVQYRQSRQGLGKDFATMSRTRTRRGMNEQASSWWSAVEGLDDAHSRLRRVVVANDDACELVAREDGPETFFYLDPPYVASTRQVARAYAHEMTEEDHGRLLKQLAGVSGRFVLSGYRCTLYDEIASECNWRRIDIKIDNKASSSKTKPIKTECLWMNY